jgi:hypothetical protein
VRRSQDSVGWEKQPAGGPAARGGAGRPSDRLAGGWLPWRWQGRAGVVAPAQLLRPRAAFSGFLRLHGDAASAMRRLQPRCRSSRQQHSSSPQLCSC